MLYAHVTIILIFSQTVVNAKLATISVYERNLNLKSSVIRNSFKNAERGKRDEIKFRVSLTLHTLKCAENSHLRL